MQNMKEFKEDKEERKEKVIEFIKGFLVILLGIGIIVSGYYISLLM